MEKSTVIHMEAPGGLRVYLTLTEKQVQRLMEIQKENPLLTRWECRQIQVKENTELPEN